MKFRYGGASLDQDSFVWSMSKSDEVNQGNLPYRRRVRWNLQGQLNGDSPSAIAAKMATLDSTFSVHFRDAVLTDNDGNILRALYTNQTLSGVRVTSGPDYPSDRNAFNTYMPWSVSLEADYAIGPNGSQNGVDPFFLISFSESLSFSGGGPVWVHVQLADVKPQKQMLYRHTPYRVTQSGSAVGRSAYPPVPPPLFPGSLTRSPSISRTTPRREGFKLEGYSVSWSYEFESAAPMVGNPTLWII